MCTIRSLHEEKVHWCWCFCVEEDPHLDVEEGLWKEKGQRKRK